MQWRPRLFNPVTGAYFDLPTPVEQFQTEFGWRYETHEVPKRAGKAHYDRKVNSITLTIAGLVGEQQGDLKLTEDEMRSVLIALYAFLKDPPVTGFTVYCYFDSNLSTADYYGFKGAFPLGLTDEMGDVQRVVFNYSLSFSVANPNPTLLAGDTDSAAEDLGGL